MNNPKIDHRVSFLEKQFLAMGGHLEGLQEDIEALQTHVDTGFNQAHAFVQERLDEINKRLAAMDSGVSQLATIQGEHSNLLKEILRRLPEKEE